MPSFTPSATWPTTCASGWPTIHQPKVAYADYDAMLADPKVEAVIIAIADQFHVPAALKAIAAGKHVLVEKPLGTAIEPCRELRDRAAAAGLVVQVGNNRRFDPGIAFAREFIVGEMGQRIALKSWYYDSVYRYTMTDNLQPIPITSAKRVASGGRPQGRPAAILSAHARQPPGRYGAVPGRADRGRACPAARAVRLLLLVHRGRFRRWLAGASRSPDPGAR